MRRTIYGILLLLALVNPAYADLRINAKIDVSKKEIRAFRYSQDFLWQGLELELEKEWRTNKIIISGFALGFRKESETHQVGDNFWREISRFPEEPNLSEYEGVYVFLRTFKRVDVGRNWSLYPSVTIFYGVPGIVFNRTWEEISGRQLRRYTRLFPIRNADIPTSVVRGMAWVYPEVSLAFRKKLWRFNIDPTVGMRMMRFGAVESDYVHSHYEEKVVWVPTAGLKVGFKF